MAEKKSQPDAIRKNRDRIHVKHRCISTREFFKSQIDFDIAVKKRTQLLNQRLDILDASVDEVTKNYTASFNTLKSEYDQLLIDNQNLKDTNEKLSEELTIAKKNEEIAQNKFQMLKKDTEDKEMIFEQKMHDTKLKFQLNEANLKLDLLSKLHKEQDLQLQEKQEITLPFEKKIKNLENELLHKTKSEEFAQLEQKALNILVSTLTCREEILRKSNDGYLRKITELEQLMENQNTKYQSEIQGLDQQLTAMKRSMCQKVEEYQNLLHNKMALDMEISIYQKTLQSQLNITSNKLGVGNPRREKRQLFLEMFQHDETEYEFTNCTTSSSIGDIVVNEVYPDRQLVKLHNKGSKEVELNGYEIICTVAGENNSSVFKLCGSLKLEAGNSLTILSSTASTVVHENNTGPIIIMNTETWVVSDFMTTIVLNAEGQEVAKHEHKKLRVTCPRGNFKKRPLMIEATDMSEEK